MDPIQKESRLIGLLFICSQQGPIFGPAQKRVRFWKLSASKWVWHRVNTKTGLFRGTTRPANLEFLCSKFIYFHESKSETETVQ